MSYLKVEIKEAKRFLKKDPFMMQNKVDEIHKMIHDKSGLGNDFLGWVDLPINYDKKEFSRILEAAKKIRKTSEVLVVIGIGGSYLGAKAGLDFLEEPFIETDLEIIFAGHQMSSEYLSNLLDYLKDKEFSVNVISKSGTTTEPAIAFRFLKKLLEEKYGIDNAKSRIYATTDKEKGALYTLAKENGYEMFIIPDDVGGRFSVLTPVGLLPLAAANIDVESLMAGAKKAYEDFLNPNLQQNSSYLYAITRALLHEEGKDIEMLVGYEPNLLYINEWWKQLFGESEGKDHKGLFVASASFSTDLHSLGQYIQDGKRHLFETVLKIETVRKDLKIPVLENDIDELNYIGNKTLSYVNEQALKGTMMAHTEGNVPNILINIPKVNSYTLGYLFYFFEKACALSAYYLDVNPFDQPGVEAYKKNMFQLLGKKGY